MSEPRKNNLNIEGGQVKEDEHIASYKPLADTEKGFRTSKSSLSKSRDKVDEAEEKLLQKDDVKVTPRVDMDAKYVVESYTNGDAKIELDANKREFTGLTKEELMRYVDDPFWVRLRWFLFVVFWALWLGMLAGAVAIIIQAPKCPPPAPKTWFQRGPLVEFDNAKYSDIQGYLPLLQTADVQGIFTSACKESTYEETPSCFQGFKDFALEAKKYGVRVIADLIANYVPKTHEWFVNSEKKIANYSDFFIWSQGKNYDKGEKQPPNNWLSTFGGYAWTLSEIRDEFYLHQFREDQPDLNFRNAAVKDKFEQVLDKWTSAGANGIRLENARLLLVDPELREERPGVDPLDYDTMNHTYTRDQSALDEMLEKWQQVVNKTGTDGVLLSVSSLGSGASAVSVPSAASAWGAREVRRVALGAPVPDVVADLKRNLVNWTLIQLSAPSELSAEVVPLAMLLPAAPVLHVTQLHREDNATQLRPGVSELVELRGEYSVQHGNWSLLALASRSSEANSTNSTSTTIACSRWKEGRTGFLALLNTGAQPAAVDLAPLPAVPPKLTLYYASPETKAKANWTEDVTEVLRDSVVVPAKSSLLFSYSPITKK